MCFSGMCKYELFNGECGKEKGQPCPFINMDLSEDEMEEEKKEEEVKHNEKTSK